MAAHGRVLALTALIVVVTVSCGTDRSTVGSPTEVTQQQAAPGPATPPPVADPPDIGTKARVPDRPAGQPPGVRHDIPRVNDNLTSQNDWVGAVRARCNEVGEGDRCLTFRYIVHEVDRNGRSRVIPNPGPGYADGESPRYDPCTVTDVRPRGGDDVTVPSGTTITVSIDCHVSEDDVDAGGGTPTVTPGAGG